MLKHNCKYLFNEFTNMKEILIVNGQFILWHGMGREYDDRINFCPYCGEKAPNQLELT